MFVSGTFEPLIVETLYNKDTSLLDSSLKL